MGAAPPFVDEDVRILLIGSAAEVAEGLSRIDRNLRLGMCGMVRREFPGLPADDLADLWGSVLTNLWQMVREGRFDPDRPLLPLLCRLARARAVDLVRRQQTRETVVTAAGEALRGTATGVAWSGLTVAERTEVAALIREAVGSLPSRQREVMQVFVDHYPETEEMQVLRRLVSERTGQPETLAAVKRALQEARVKVREHLRLKGYGVGKVGAP